jgi:transcriptional regulator with AAA-type ATPase domain/pSer/pThr/pTyr-binding forkhead associated (FHA) protein
MVGKDQATMALQSDEIPRSRLVTGRAYLEVVRGESNPQKMFLGMERVKIGRSGYNDLVLPDGKVSREHAEICFENGRYLIVDLNSTNGLFVNDALVQKIPLKSGDRLTIGDTKLLFFQQEPEVSLPEKETFIQKSDLFNWLDRETKLLLAQNLVVRSFPKGAVILKQNTLVESMFFLYSGKIRIVELNEEGGERLIDRLNPGDFFGERALLAGESGEYSMIAEGDCTLLELRKEQLNELLQKKPDLNQAFYRMVLTKLRSAQAESDRKGKRRDNLKDIITPTDVRIVGEDRKILEAKKRIEELAKSGKTALIIGPTGTGKRTFARFFHQVSPHPDYPYVEISLADLEETQVGSSLFGIEPEPGVTHMKGQVGYLEMIGMGTLAIAHAELLDAHQQSKLVTYLKFGWFHRVYGQKSVRAQTRVVFLASGTEAEVMEKFIPELRQELEKHKVVLPPLIQRLKDIPLLADYYLKNFARKNGKHIGGLSREATEKLVTYTWPGNVKELKNVIQRAAIVSSEKVIIPGDLIFVLPSEKEIHKLNLLHREEIWNFLRHPLIPKVFMWFNVLMVVVMAGFTLYGGTRPAGHPLQEPGNNPGMLITWLIWFPLLPISAFLLGRIWCGMCPIAGIGDFFARIKKFNLPAPTFLKNMNFWLVILAFLFLEFTEEIFGVADKPLATGLLLVIIIGLSVLFCVLYERKTFCRYVCPLAAVLGAYSTLSVVEVRGNKKVCQTQCGQHTCFKGSEKVEGCPMFSYPASLSSNSECMLCLNCLKNCENRGVRVNLRPPLQELWHQHQPLFSISFFGVMLVGLMARHQFTHLTFWKAWEQSLGWGEFFSNMVMFVFFLLFAIIPFSMSSSLSAAASQEKISENMAHFGLAFIPLALAGHISHLTHELLSEGVYELIKYLIKIYDWLVLGVAVGSREPVLSSFIHEAVVTFIKVMLILGGFLGSVIALVMIARKLSEKNVFARILPHLLVLVFFLGSYLFIFISSTEEPLPPQPQAATVIPGAQVPGGTQPRQ